MIDINEYGNITYKKLLQIRKASNIDITKLQK